MRKAAVTAYPDPNHHYRINIKAVVAHSNRVTVAVALFSMKLSIEDITFRLQWKPESVQHYIRPQTVPLLRLQQGLGLQGVHIVCPIENPDPYPNHDLQDRANR